MARLQMETPLAVLGDDRRLYAAKKSFDPANNHPSHRILNLELFHMPNTTPRDVEVTLSYRSFSEISDSDLVAAMLDDSTRRDPCPGFSALIGTPRKRRLDGSDSKRLTDAGLAPNVYFAIRWWCLCFLPVLPLGAYAVTDYRSIDRPFSDPHSRAFPVAMDWRIAGFQAALGLVAVAFAVTIGFWVIAL